jgi:hypothetical protein
MFGTTNLNQILYSKKKDWLEVHPLHSPPPIEGLSKMSLLSTHLISAKMRLKLIKTVKNKSKYHYSILF